MILLLNKTFKNKKYNLFSKLLFFNDLYKNGFKIKSVPTTVNN